MVHTNRAGIRCPSVAFRPHSATDNQTGENPTSLLQNHSRKCLHQLRTCHANPEVHDPGSATRTADAAPGTEHAALHGAPAHAAAYAAPSAPAQHAPRAQAAHCPMQT